MPKPQKTSTFVGAIAKASRPQVATKNLNKTRFSEGRSSKSAQSVHRTFYRPGRLAGLNRWPSYVWKW
jgi:hypothetical protein